MNILYFCPLWGNTLPFSQFCSNVKKAGYDGVEMDLPLEKKKTRELLKILDDHGLLLIGQYWQSLEKDFRSNKKNYERYLHHLAEASPLKINTQTGKDYFPLAWNMELIQIAKQISSEAGIPIVHETHRGKFLFSLPVFLQAIKEDPSMRITFDVSHWCTVHESLLQDQQAGVSRALRASSHIHSRVGFEEGPQINDPRAPEWKKTISTYFGWWDQILALHKASKKDITVTTEFGPAPYMPLLPRTQKPVSSQWEVNLHMMRLFKTRYKNTK